MIEQMSMILRNINTEKKQTHYKEHKYDSYNVRNRNDYVIAPEIKIHIQYIQLYLQWKTVLIEIIF